MKWIYFLSTLTFLALAVAAVLTGRGWAWAIVFLIGGFATLVWGFVMVRLTQQHLRSGQQQLDGDMRRR
ncbi:hypothetical protein ACXM2N_08980 [Corynebacterium sp. ZY180755]